MRAGARSQQEKARAETLTYAYQVGLSATEIGMDAAIALYMFMSVFAVVLLVYLRREE